MFISKLTQAIETYDPYGLNRFNGIKMLYILLILFASNTLFDIPHPYFYFFYIPLTVMSLELTANTLKDKYVFFIYTSVVTTIFVICLNFFRLYPVSFFLFVFIASFSFYTMALRRHYLTLSAVSIILSLFAYSLNYPEFSITREDNLNNLRTSFMAISIIVAALLLFPRSYYFRIWLRAFHRLLSDTLDRCTHVDAHLLARKKQISSDTIQLMRATNMLPSKLPIYTILKINLLSNQLHAFCCTMHEPFSALTPNKRSGLVQGIRALLTAIEKEQPCSISTLMHPYLISLIRAWNRLCLTI